MKVKINQSAKELGQRAGIAAANLVCEAIKSRDEASIILATGTSQFETLRALILDPSIDWSKVIMFHLDEYIGLPDTHPASFRKYLKERFIDQVPPLKQAYLINGETDPTKECNRLGEIISRHVIDVALVGIGENGHLAFNDPPADFETEKPYIIVELDEACRRQQMGEGWFKNPDDVPRQAISMSIKQILKSKHIICSVPEKRKALAVKNAIENLPDPKFPASILQRHTHCTCFLDLNSASLLTQKQKVNL